MAVHKLGTFRQYEILLAVYRTRSLSAAAKQLHLSQPTVSMQLKKLSDQVDARLYDAVGRKLVFTQAGKVLVAAAEEVIDRMTLLSQQLESLHGYQSGVLKLAVVTSAKYFIPHLLGPFCQRFPGIDIQLKVGNREQIIERVNKATDDFYVFSQLPQNSDISAIEFLPNPLVAIAPASSSLAKRHAIPLSEFAEQPFIMREAGSGTRLAIEQFLAEHKTQLNIRMTIESNEAIKHCVLSELGVSILSAHAIALGGQDGLVTLPVQGFPIVSRWSFAWPRAKQLSPVADIFLKYVQQEGRNVLMQTENLSRQ